MNISFAFRNRSKVKCLLLLSSSSTEERVCTGTKMNRRSRVLYESKLFIVVPDCFVLDMKKIELKNSACVRALDSSILQTQSPSRDEVQQENVCVTVI